MLLEWLKWTNKIILCSQTGGILLEATIGDTDEVSFYSKDKFLKIKGKLTEHAGYMRGFVRHRTPDYEVMPSIIFE